MKGTICCEEKCTACMACANACPKNAIGIGVNKYGYEKVVIDLGKRYGRGETFTIEAKNVSRKNKYVQSATLNGKKLDCFFFPASELLKGGELILEMGDKPNESWGIYSCPVGVNR